MNDNSSEKSIVNYLIKCVYKCKWSKSDEGKRIVEKIKLFEKSLSKNRIYKEHADVALEIMTSLMSGIFGKKGQCIRLLNSWAEVEPVFYVSSEKYRDHLLHSFNTFLLGLVMGEELGILNIPSQGKSYRKKNGLHPIFGNILMLMQSSVHGNSLPFFMT